MKKLLLALSLTLISLPFFGCEFIGDVFKTGVWVGLIIMIAVLAVVIFIYKLFKN